MMIGEKNYVACDIIAIIFKGIVPGNMNVIFNLFDNEWLFCSRWICGVDGSYGTEQSWS